MKEKLKETVEFFKRANSSFLLKQKIRRIYRNCSGEPAKVNINQIDNQYKSLWSRYKKNISNLWLKTYVIISGVSDHRFIPEDIYYSEIEPRLNNKAFSKAYTDKNAYHKFMDKGILPHIYLRSISGVFYDEDYISIADVNTYLSSVLNEKNIIKPSIDGGGGYEVRLLELKSQLFSINPSIKGITQLDQVLKYYKRDFLIQQYIEQHSYFGKFNPDSLNTIRILTYRSLLNEDVKILHRIFRIGRPGSIVDNQSSGGIACGITEEGELAEFGVDKNGLKYYESNSVKFSEAGAIPFIDEISLLSKSIAGVFHYSRLLGLDFAVNREGRILLVEVNDNNNEINFYQMTRGPLFGDFTDEIVNLCIKEPKSFVMDFYV